MLSAVVAIPAIPKEGRGGRRADTVEGRVRVYKKLDLFEQHFNVPCARVQSVEQFLNPLFKGEFKSDFHLPSPVIALSAQRTADIPCWSAPLATGREFGEARQFPS
jgi:hypothetical protein